MVGIVIVSHSHRIAEGVVELAREMGGTEVTLEHAGGLAQVDAADGPARPIGTDAVQVMQAIERAWSDDGVLVLMDLGSAVLSAEMALDMMDEERRANVVLCEAPLVEGAVAAAVTAKLGLPLDRVAGEARTGLAGKIAHLGADVAGSAGEGEPGNADEARTAVVTTLRVDLPHGLHARPAARLVQTAGGFDARLEVRNLRTGAGPADGASLNRVATLGVRAGDEIEVRATGPGAAAAIAALEELGARRFDEPAAEPAVDADIGRPNGGEPMPGGPLIGSAASPGVALGEVRRLHAPQLQPPGIDAPPGDAAAIDEQLAALDEALDATARAVREQRDRIATLAGEDQARIFDAHLLFLRDGALLDPAREAIREGTCSAARAWHDAVDQVAARWDALEDRYLADRAIDLRSVGAQVLARILGVEMPAPRLDVPGVLVVGDLTPADAAALDPATAMGIVAARGGPTSHAAVVARAIGIPAVVGVGPHVLSLAEGIPLAVDGGRGQVWVEPSAEVVARFEAERSETAERLARLRRLAGSPATTRDGTSVEVAANIGGPGEVAKALAAGADGIGLFRTEYLFMHRETLPDEREQEAAYRAVAESLGGRPMLVRTLDAGADKPIAALRQGPEPNPFLGVRGIRLGLQRPELLLAQLRALLRVAADHPVRVMFPMIATTDELGRALEAVETARREAAIDVSIEVGIMIEVPAAALTAASLAERADFFSIGTNDLTQYTLAADRGNERVAALADPLHPSVLRLIAATVDGAAEHGRWVGVCGELAGDRAATGVLLGLGVRELSMAPPAIPAVKDAVRSTTLDDARALAAHALTCATATEVRASLPT